MMVFPVGEVKHGVGQHLGSFNIDLDIFLFFLEFHISYVCHWLLSFFGSGMSIVSTWGE